MRHGPLLGGNFSHWTSLNLSCTSLHLCHVNVEYFSGSFFSLSVPCVLCEAAFAYPTEALISDSAHFCWRIHQFQALSLIIKFLFVAAGRHKHTFKSLYGAGELFFPVFMLHRSLAFRVLLNSQGDAASDKSLSLTLLITVGSADASRDRNQSAPMGPKQRLCNGVLVAADRQQTVYLLCCTRWLICCKEYPSRHVLVLPPWLLVRVSVSEGSLKPLSGLDPENI